MTPLLILSAIVGVSGLVVYLELRHAPVGRQDESGFTSKPTAKLSEAKVKESAPAAWDHGVGATELAPARRG